MISALSLGPDTANAQLNAPRPVEVGQMRLAASWRAATGRPFRSFPQRHQQGPGSHLLGRGTCPERLMEAGASALRRSAAQTVMTPRRRPPLRRMPTTYRRPPPATRSPNAVGTSSDPDGSRANTRRSGAAEFSGRHRPGHGRMVILHASGRPADQGPPRVWRVVVHVRPSSGESTAWSAPLCGVRGGGGPGCGGSTGGPRACRRRRWRARPGRARRVRRPWARTRLPGVSAGCGEGLSPLPGCWSGVHRWREHWPEVMHRG